MLKARSYIAVILLSAIFTGYAGAQTMQVQQDAKASSPAVTASASDGGARYTAPGGVLQVRLEIYAATGEIIFDSGQRAGSIIDWKVADVLQGMSDGSYLSVVTVRDLRGKYSQRLGSVTLSGGSVTVARALETELSAAQTQALSLARQTRQIASPANDDSAMTILSDGKKRAVTVTTHDGENGQVTSTSGALTLNTGDVMSGKDKEQVRITPEGRVGIGTAKPEETLDVAGTIRARGGIRFDDGSLLTSASNLSPRINVMPTTGARQATSGSEPTPSLIGGTGTLNRIAKWTDNSGTLGDSSIVETGGLTILGQTAPLFPTAPGFHVLEVGATNNKSPLTLAGGSAVMEMWSDLGNGTGAPAAAVSYGMAKPGTPATDDLVLSTYKLNIGWNERMRVMNTGNVGIGTPAPSAKLEVVGGFKLTGLGNGITFPDGTVMTSATVGSGSPSGTSIVAAINDAATAGVISENRLGFNVARLNGANAWSSSNVFGAGLSANNALVTNVGNPVNAGDAVNKAYTDANFVKFVPGAEQLSVGDANGTAPMINLRGGSTCCSGPGGHTPAWFKVFQNGSFVATGNLGIGVSPMQGKGYRTSWDSYKGAFRSGYADNEWDDATVGFFSWAGGSNSTAEGLYAFAFGDTNFARSTSSIAFGSGNEVKGAAGFTAGAGNRVCDTYGVAFGNKAQSGGPLINGKCDPDSFNLRGLAAVAIGYNVTADQDHTTAMGKFASNNGFSGTFVWSDGSATASADTFRNNANNEFAARATGGFRFRTNLTGTTGCNLPAGSGVFNCTSSRTTKENFMAVDGDDVLGRLRKVPVTTWNYINEGGQVRHIGPMAEDFHSAFGLGTGNTSIGVQDLAGVNLIAVKALEARTAKLQESNAQLDASLKQKNAEVEQLRSELNSLRKTTDVLVQRLDALEHAQPNNTEPLATKPGRE
jgi:phage shock protein A